MTAGRPRQFDYDEALDRAMHVFWQKGFEGTSMPDLTEAMGINRPSIYASFGNKEELFRKALARYSDNAIAFFRERLEAPTTREALERLFCGSADSFSCNEKPRGCLSVQGALVGSDDSEAIRQESIRRREAIVGVFQERFDRGIKDADLPADTDTRALARFYTTILQGMSVQSASGATCAEMKDIAHRALEALPKT
ncbi:MAG: TetR/AcrR family transcriptional regulator [Alphaproteobacteria bacterium]|nr:TetR/AcrR family transcriptional regulator [Alphaproteobacteria bacterium]